MIFPFKKGNYHSKIVFENFHFENNKNKPNKAKLFDMTSIPSNISKNSTLYKTTRFRGGRLYFFDKNYDERKTKKNIIYARF